MNVQIETIPLAFNSPSINSEMYDIIKKAQDSKSLDDLSQELSTEKYEEFIFGFGSSHCWVKQIDFRTNKPMQDRLLLITEK